MSTRELLITAVAIIVLLASMGAVWGIDQYKSDQQLEAKKATLVENHYETPANPKQYRIVIVKASERDQPASEVPTTPLETEGQSPEGGQSRSSTTTSSSRRTPTQTADFDDDGIPDASDRCPTRPETMNGFQDGDGCPDVVETSTGAS